MEQSLEEFFHDFRQELLAGAEAGGNFQLSQFMETVAAELVETGFIEGFELCDYRASRGVRVDGYWFNEDGSLDLFIADFDSRNKVESLTRTDIVAIFRRLTNFFEASMDKRFAEELEITSPAYGLARQICDRKRNIHKLNLFLFSERLLSERIQEIPDTEIVGIPASHQIWDVSRLYRQRSSKGHKEPLDLDLEAMFGRGLFCLPAHLGEEAYRSYLIVVPGDVLATLYEKYGARLLEQNVRTFLQARGDVNKGIRETILNEPGMFFAYNNGVTATAQSVVTRPAAEGLLITGVRDLQIVNGGQTTASLFHARKRDKADLSRIFVQMKLSVIDSEQVESVVPRISEYANTQNKVNAADFFSTHPFHIRMESFSRRLWAPAKGGAQRETKWFYERARGQYLDAQSKLTPGEKKRFLIENPRHQMFSKTDLAKFENVWDDHPKWVNLGSQKNFVRYANRIGTEWEKSSDSFNEWYYRRAVARGIVFRSTEKIVSGQAWYNGGYRANIVAYTLAVLSEIAKRKKASIDFQSIWQSQELDPVLQKAIAVVAKVVNEDITQPPAGISNISEWCKKDGCWERIKSRIAVLEELLPQGFHEQLISVEEDAEESRNAKKVQKIDDGIAAQQKVMQVSPTQWDELHKAMSARFLLTQKESEILKVAMQIPRKIPSEKQSVVLLGLLEKGRSEGIRV